METSSHNADAAHGDEVTSTLVLLSLSSAVDLAGTQPSTCHPPSPMWLDTITWGLAHPLTLSVDCGVSVAHCSREAPIRVRDDPHEQADAELPVFM